MGRKYRTCRLATLRREGSAYVRQLAIENFTLLRDTLLWNIQHEIYFFRVSSDLIPFASHPELDWRWWEDEAILSLAGEIRSLQQKYDMRLSTHPGQYTVLNSPNPDVISRAVAEIQYHVQLMDLLNAKDMILHIGGVYGDKQAAKARFVETVQRLPEPLSRPIRVENDDVSFHVEDALEVAKACGLPMCLDYHHHRCLPCETPLAELVPSIFRTWGDVRPKVHISSGRTSDTDSAHHDMVSRSDFEALQHVLHTNDVDVMLEAKQKEQAVLDLLPLVR